eukprot:GHVS01041077.1.p1 GENE.GHVS01041077.1~~GHVS01041077.1.p1  ORF type:complete len:235 (+),score=44.20 GHVS01041077.1:274-978(+)
MCCSAVVPHPLMSATLTQLGITLNKIADQIAVLLKPDWVYFFSTFGFVVGFIVILFILLLSIDDYNHISTYNKPIHLYIQPSLWSSRLKQLLPNIQHQQQKSCAPINSTINNIMTTTTTAWSSSTARLPQLPYSSFHNNNNVCSIIAAQLPFSLYKSVVISCSEHNNNNVVCCCVGTQQYRQRNIEGLLGGREGGDNQRQRTALSNSQMLQTCQPVRETTTHTTCVHVCHQSVC